MHYINLGVWYQNSHENAFCKFTIQQFWKRHFSSVFAFNFFQNNLKYNRCLVVKFKTAPSVYCIFLCREARHFFTSKLQTPSKSVRLIRALPCYQSMLQTLSLSCSSSFLFRVISGELGEGEGEIWWGRGANLVWFSCVFCFNSYLYFMAIFVSFM